MSARPDRMKAVMIVAGLLPATMIHGAFDPQGALQATFGEGLQGPLAGVVVRNWAIDGAMVGIFAAHLASLTRGSGGLPRTTSSPTSFP
jgi:hypothetical protein